jgi:galactokinase
VTHDLDQFERHLTQLERGAAFPPLFDPARPLLLARAPGRLDVMGGFADYSGSLALELPIAEGAYVAVQATTGPVARIVSAGFGGEHGTRREAHLVAAELRLASRSYAAAQAWFRAQAEQSWAAYVAGALVALSADFGLELEGGLSLLVASSVPEGKGVSSSAALEVASFIALSALLGLEVDPREAALACQRVENRVVGAPCGVMDQMTSCCGSAGQLLPLLCQPAKLESRFPLPRELSVWGIDSGLSHQVSGADYTQVRVAAFMGYTIIARALGLPSAPGSRPGQLRIDDALYRGYLANLDVGSFERELAPRLPERMTGEEFLREYHGIVDPVTEVVPQQTYRVRAATAHPVHEHARASEFRELLQRVPSAEVGARLGELMYAAHRSYGACGLGSAGTDRLVELVREAGVGRGLYGAKITGGGSGGTVAVLGASSAEATLLAVAAQYARETGRAPHVFSGSSPGAAEFGVREVHHRDGHWRVERRGSAGPTPPKGRA